MNVPRINVPPAAAAPLALVVDGDGGGGGDGDGGGVSCVWVAGRSPPPPVSCDLFLYYNKCRIFDNDYLLLYRIVNIKS